MFGLMAKKEFVAQHYLCGGNWGAENLKHSHHYELEIEIEDEMLDEHNYLVDIVDLDERMENLCGYFRDKTLNDLPEFKDSNPSIELFSKIVWDKFCLSGELNLNSLVTVRLWENKIARASYRERKK